MTGKKMINLILILALTVFLISCGIDGKPVGEPDSPFEAPEDTAVINPIERINLEEAFSDYEMGEAVFLDVRDTRAFERSRIPGSINIPLIELASRLDELNPEDKFITV